MKNPDILLALKPAVNAFNQLSIPYYIGGSIASSLFGIARATMDIDIVAYLIRDQVHAFVEMLHNEYYIDEQMIEDAIENASSFNLIHLETMMKIDIFIYKEEPYHQSALSRRCLDLLVDDDQDSTLYFSSPEDIILSKLRWYEMGNRVSERQWMDIIGVIKVQSDSLDKDYLSNWSKSLGLFDLLKQAYFDAGITF
jgi:hypothetical protein